MIAEFNWWLLILGVVGGGVLTWLVLAESSRREREIGDEELAAEATWIARTVEAPGMDAAAAEEVLRAHRRYLGFPPPDVLVAPEELDRSGPPAAGHGAGDTGTVTALEATADAGPLTGDADANEGAPG